MTNHDANSEHADRPITQASAASLRHAVLVLSRRDRDRLHGELQHVEREVERLAADFSAVIHRTCPDQTCGEMHERVMARTRTMLDALAELDAILALFRAKPETEAGGKKPESTAPDTSPARSD